MINKANVQCNQHSVMVTIITSRPLIGCIQVTCRWHHNHRNSRPNRLSGWPPTYNITQCKSEKKQDT